ncbi:hypothetical protein NKH36_33660 [Mesorhizobium sp. M1312]|uniref:hypothetical protein n=1 Tax=unclassified Mesorhizobium TaxID=325217 RepID=UPI00333BB27A
MNEIGLRGRRPPFASRPRAPAEARPVKGEHSVSLGRLVEYAAGFEILGRRAVSVQQDQRHPVALFKDVEAFPCSLDEAPRRMRETRPLGASAVVQRQASQPRAK